MTKFSKAFVDSLDKEPTKWILGSYCLSYGRNKAVELWIANGFYGFKVYEPHKIEFGFFEKREIFKAFKRWQKAEGSKQIEKQKQEIVGILKMDEK